MSCYDLMNGPPNGTAPTSTATLTSILISDMNVHVSPNKLKAAAIHHLTRNGSGVLQISFGSESECDFGNANLFPKMFLCLFPYGIGGLEDTSCMKKISFNTHIKHLL